METPASVRPVQAVISAVRVLRALSSGKSLTVSEIARQAGLYPGTSFQILWSLIGERLVAFDPAAKTYRAHLGLLELSHGVLRRTGVLEVARAHVRRLADDHGLSVSLLHRVREDTLLVLEHTRSGSELDEHVVTGLPLSAWRGAVGRVVAAYAGGMPETLRARFESVPWQNPPSFEQWLEDLERTRADGFAVDRGHLFRGITVAAARIPAGAGDYFLTAIFVSANVGEAAVTTIGCELRDAAASIAQELELLRSLRGESADQGAAGDRA